MAPSLLVTFQNAAELLAAYRDNLSEGRAWLPGEHELSVGETCMVVVVHPQSGATLEIEAEVAEVEAEGVLVRFGLTPLKRNQLAKLVGEERSAQSLHERLRGLTPIQRRKLALTGDHSERVALERIYGKAVWESLLQNPQLTVPEVARLARLGTMPRPLLEQIVSNGAWVRVPQVRRALLSNRRLDAPMINRVLMHTPPPELKLVPRQTAYPPAVRNTAKRMLKKGG